MPVSGARRLRSTSTARALSGETYRTRQVAASGSVAGVVSRSRAQRKAARVLPEPVGATTRAWSPALIACQAPAWASVGRSKAPVNQARVAAEKGARASCPLRPASAVVDMRHILPGTTDKCTGARSDNRTGAGPGGHPWHAHPVRMSEFWTLVDGEFGAAAGRALVRDHVLGALGHRTAQQALDAGEPHRTVWLALCEDLQVPPERWLGVESAGPTRRGRRPATRATRRTP